MHVSKPTKAPSWALPARIAVHDIPNSSAICSRHARGTPAALTAQNLCPDLCQRACMNASAMTRAMSQPPRNKNTYKENAANQEYTFDKAVNNRCPNRRSKMLRTLEAPLQSSRRSPL